MNNSGSVTTWLGLLAQGDPAAAQQLWERYFARLMELARARLRGLSKRVADEEDVALSAFHTFVQAAAARRLPQVQDRDDLWHTLILITAGKAVDERRRQNSRKRGGHVILNAAGTDSATRAALETVIGSEPDPAFAAEVAEQFQVLLHRLDDDRLREIALLKLEGHSHEEIATRLQCSIRSVSRRLLMIRRIWEDADADEEVT
jgi:DNA-directed RNA polymerase specialized sigma24 family protein